MNQSKFFLGIGITVLGGFILLMSLIFGIIHFAGNLYNDIRTFNVEIPSTHAVQKTPLFTHKKDQILSFWFKYPDRQLENKDFNIAVSLVDENKNILATFGEDFTFGYFRNSSREGQYYKLGEYKFKNNFSGQLQYEINGTWLPTKAGNIIFRQSLSFPLPIKQIGFFIMGIFIFMVGIKTIAKTKKKTDNKKIKELP